MYLLEARISGTVRLVGLGPRYRAVTRKGISRPLESEMYLEHFQREAEGGSRESEGEKRMQCKKERLQHWNITGRIKLI